CVFPPTHLPARRRRTTGRESPPPTAGARSSAGCFRRAARRWPLRPCPSGFLRHPRAVECRHFIEDQGCRPQEGGDRGGARPSPKPQAEVEQRLEAEVVEGGGGP